MRVVLQRVHSASVHVSREPARSIERGLLLFLGIEQDDQNGDVRWLTDKIIRIRCFENPPGRMTESLLDIDGQAMVISQFTLFGSLRKGTRPSFNRSADPDVANQLYLDFANQLAHLLGKPVPTGSFGKPMRIDACNDGPVTLILDSHRRDF